MSGQQPSERTRGSGTRGSEPVADDQELTAAREGGSGSNRATAPWLLQGDDLDFYRDHVRESCARAEDVAARPQSGDLSAFRVVRRLWTECELPSQCPTAWASIWASVRAESRGRRVMTWRERRALSALPDPLTVHRGASPGGERGWSWTLERSVAAEFAVRYVDLVETGSGGRVCTARVGRRDVIAYFQLGREHEVIIDPQTIDWDTVIVASA